MPPPVMFPCGGTGQRPCPPQTAITTSTEEAVHAYGDACYEAGKAELQAKVDWLQGRLDARDRVAESIPVGTFTVRNINKSDL